MAIVQVKATSERPENVTGVHACNINLTQVNLKRKVQAFPNIICGDWHLKNVRPTSSAQAISQQFSENPKECTKTILGKAIRLPIHFLPGKVCCIGVKFDTNLSVVIS